MLKKLKRSSADIASQTVQALVWGPKTRSEIAAYVGVSRNDTTVVMRYVASFRRDGLVYVIGWDNRARARYAWQPSPYLHADVPQPERRRP